MIWKFSLSEQMILPFRKNNCLESLKYVRSIKTKFMCLAGLNLVVRSQQQPVISHTGLKRPTAPLPRFKGEDLYKFFATFEETTNKYSYTEFDKLILLKQQLSGRALVLIDSLEIRNQIY